MRIIPFEITIERGGFKWGSFVISIFHFDWPENDASLFELGWYQGRFCLDFLGIHYLWKLYLEDYFKGD